MERMPFTEKAAMDWDDMKPKVVKGVVVGESLENLSLADLEERVGLLQQEIERVRAELAAKKAHGSAADAIFKR